MKYPRISLFKKIICCILVFSQACGNLHSLYAQLSPGNSFEFVDTYSVSAIFDILYEVFLLDEEKKCNQTLTMILDEVERGKICFSQETIAACLQEIWQILEEYHSCIENIDLLLDWYGRLVAFSLDCGIKDQFDSRAPREGVDIDSFTPQLVIPSSEEMKDLVVRDKLMIMGEIQSDGPLNMGSHLALRAKTNEVPCITFESKNLGEKIRVYSTDDSGEHELCISSDHGETVALQVKENSAVNLGEGAFFVDTSNHRVGIGIQTPQVPLDIGGDAQVAGNLSILGDFIPENISVVSNATVNGTSALVGNVGIGAAGVGEAKLVVDGGVHIGGTSDPGDNNLTVDGLASILGNTNVSGHTTLQTLQTLGHVDVSSTIAFAQGIPGVPHNTLIVTKGLASSPDEFNSINAALASITDASATNPYVIKVGPGVFVEDTVVMKPFVSLVGDTPYTSIVEVNNPSKDVLVAAPDSSLRYLQLRGATDPGKAAIVYHGGGWARITDCIFGSNDIICLVDATVPYISSFLIGSSEVLTDSNFTYMIKSVATGPIPVFIKCDDVTWVAFENPNLDAVIDLSGTYCYMVASDVTAGAFTTLGNGTGIRLTDRANVSLNASVFSGFNTCVDMPNVGDGPSIIFSSVYARNNVIDLNVQNPRTTGIISCVFAKDKSIITEMDPTTEGLRLFFSDSITGTMTVGPQHVGDTIDHVTNISPQIQQASSLGVIRGGVLSVVAGREVQVTEGAGYVMDGTPPPDDYLKYIEWDAQSIVLDPNKDHFLYIDKQGVLCSADSEPSYITAVNVGKARTNATAVDFIQRVPRQAEHAATCLDDSWRQALGNVYASGSLVTKNGTLQLDVSPGHYYFGTQAYAPSGGTAVAWKAFYRNGSGDFTIVDQDVVDFQHYDDGSGDLATVSDDQYVRHALYVVGDGDDEAYLFVYGQETHTSLLAAQNGTIPPQPGLWTGNIALVASVITKNSAVEGDRIAEIRDERPRLGFKASGVSVVTDHGDLTGLLDDDHPHYLLVSGTRAMTGDLSLGNNNITNVGTVDGVDVSLHAARHVPNGFDPLPTATAVTIGTANAEGIQNSFARSDHIHAHGDHAGGALHALATTGAHGFMSSSDKTKLDTLDKSDYVHKAGDTMTGTLLIDAGGANGLVINTDKFVVDNTTGNTAIDGSLTVDGTTQLTSFGTGVVHSDATGRLLSSLLVNADIDSAASIVDTKLATISTEGKVANSATTASSLNTAGALVARDGNGDFSAGTITATLSGTATSFSGNLSGDVTGTQNATVVETVGGTTAENVATATTLANAATSVNSASQIVKRDVNGNFAAGIISANLAGNANTATLATTATNFTGNLSGDVIGTQGMTSVTSVGGQLAANIASGVIAANEATNLNVANRLVARDSNGDFSARIITATLDGNAATATTAASLSGPFSGDVTGTQDSMNVALVGGQSAAAVATGSVAANAATSANSASTLVKRDSNGDFSAGTITANLDGNATTATTATNVSGSLIGDVTGVQSATVVSAVGGETAANVATGSVLANAATHLNTASQIVKRDGSGNFNANTITANLTGAASANVLKTGDTMSGPLVIGGSNDLTVGGNTQLQTLETLGHVTINSTIEFTQGTPGAPANTLLVTKGAAQSANEFNSISEALASINDASETNLYLIKVGPGVFVEDTIVMKPYVSLVGDTPYATVIEVNDPSKDVLIAAPNSAIRYIQLRGATGSGKAAIVYHGGGWSRVTDCLFGANDIIFLVDALEPYISSLLIGSSEILTGSNFTYIIKSVATGPIPVFIKCDDFTWVDFENPNLDAAIDLSGIYCYLVASDLTLGAFTTLGSGTGIRLTDRANVSLNASVFSGFDTCVDMPNVGDGPSIIFSSVYARNNVIDLNVQNPRTTGIISCVFAKEKTIITDMDPTTEGLRLFFSDSISGTMTVGPQQVGNKIDQVTNINPQIQQASSLGVIRGGELSDEGGLDLGITAGDGYLMVGDYPDDYLKYVEWDEQVITLQANKDNFVYIDENGIVHSSLSVPNYLKTILIAKARTDATGMLYCQHVQKEANHTATKLDESWRHALGPVYKSGSIVEKNGTLQLDVSSGSYYFGTHNYMPSGGSAIDWYSWYRNGSGEYTVSTQNAVDFDHYDNGSGTLASIPDGQYARHALYVVDFGPNEKYLMVYGQEPYATLSAAQAGTIPPQPASWSGNIALIASVIVKNTDIESSRIAEIRDERPKLGFKASGISVVTDHGNLIGLLDDDHPQYFLASGTRAMAGDLSMGSHNITNVGTIDGVDIALHASRHLPNGFDPLPTAAPVTIGGANVEGVQNSFARSDHIHAHGNQVGGTLHALATSGVAGFMSAADKVKLDTLDGATFVPVVGGSMTGALAVNKAGVNAFTVNEDKLTVNGTTGAVSVAGTLDVGGATTLTNLGQGVVHTNGSGLLTSSLITNSDIHAAAAIEDSKLAQISTVGKVANSATTATANNINNSIVARDSSGNFSAGTITANLVGTATSFNGSLVGDVTGTQGATVVNSVGGQAAADVATATLLANNATNLNTGSKIVKRDASGNFSAGIITANLIGNATSANTATTATNFTGNLVGEVTGTQGATVVSSLGGQTAANVAAATLLANNATHVNTANQIVKRDGSGNFSAGTITANLIGNASSATSTNNFSGSLQGDVTGVQGATIVSSVGGKTALETASAVTLANNATHLNTASRIVKRDGSGNFSAGTITANLTGTASGNVAKSGDTMTGTLNVPTGSLKSLSIAFNGDSDTGIYSPGANQLVFVTGGLQRLTLDSSGSARLACDYKVSAYLDSNYRVNTNNTIRVPYDTEVFDPSGSFSVHSNKFTAPASGYYWVAAQVGVIAKASTIENKIIRLMRNNDPIPACENETLVLGYWGAHVSIPITGMVYLDAGDNLWVQYDGSKDDYIMGTYTNLHIHFMSL